MHNKVPKTERYDAINVANRNFELHEIRNCGIYNVLGTAIFTLKCKVCSLSIGSAVQAVSWSINKFHIYLLHLTQYIQGLKEEKHIGAQLTLFQIVELPF